MTLRMTQIKNGQATILEAYQCEGRDDYLQVLLCYLPHNDEFVVWLRNLHDVERGFDGTYHGVYCYDLSSAVTAFKRRCSMYAPVEEAV